MFRSILLITSVQNYIYQMVYNILFIVFVKIMASIAYIVICIKNSKFRVKLWTNVWAISQHGYLQKKKINNNIIWSICFKLFNCLYIHCNIINLLYNIAMQRQECNNVLYSLDFTSACTIRHAYYIHSTHILGYEIHVSMVNFHWPFGFSIYQKYVSQKP